MSTRRARPPAVDAAAGTRAARLLGWPGVVLAAMPLFGVRVLPVVVLDLDAHQARQATGNGPQFDADTLAVWEWPESTGQAPPPVVAVSGPLISNPNPDGLHVFRSCGDVAQWHRPVDWSRMPAALPTAWEGRNGITVHLADGATAVVTTGGGCGCGSPLREWAGPSWGNRIRVG